MNMMKFSLNIFFAFYFFGCASYVDPLTMEQCVSSGMVNWNERVSKGGNVKTEQVYKKHVMEQCAKGLQ
jgi:hypothetical protein